MQRCTKCADTETLRPKDDPGEPKNPATSSSQTRSAAAPQSSTRAPATTTTADTPGITASTRSLQGPTGKPPAAAPPARGAASLPLYKPPPPLQASSRSRTEPATEMSDKEAFRKLLNLDRDEQAKARPVTSGQRDPSASGTKQSSHPSLKNSSRAGTPAPTAGPSTAAIDPLPVVAGSSRGPSAGNQAQSEPHLGQEDGAQGLIAVLGRTQRYTRPQSFLAPVSLSADLKDSETDRYRMIARKFRDFPGVLDYEGRSDFYERINDLAERNSQPAFSSRGTLKGIYEQWASVAIHSGFVPLNERGNFQKLAGQTSWTEEKLRLQASNQNWVISGHFNVPEYWRTRELPTHLRREWSKERLSFAQAKARGDTDVLPYEERDTFVKRRPGVGSDAQYTEWLQDIRNVEILPHNDEGKEMRTTGSLLAPPAQARPSTQPPSAASIRNRTALPPMQPGDGSQEPPYYDIAQRLLANSQQRAGVQANPGMQPQPPTAPGGAGGAGRGNNRSQTDPGYRSSGPLGGKDSRGGRGG
ncbi:hypothetical protein LTR37_015172 [Vermiconidia calcicola]|uniref:Uncharacterized protein n=1 Tax=Vermiconidia calcicola TaxID=1690605 RepID=A0ACC3MSE5_9PEZI|nr:hypothetical protein LTR37_015172 [Vermiconidia calcicola]